MLTSSAMRVINSISDNAEDVKIPNICVNEVIVLIMSLNNSVNVSEKCDLFCGLGQQLLLLTGKIENDNEIGSLFGDHDRRVDIQIQEMVVVVIYYHLKKW